MKRVFIFLIFVLLCCISSYGIKPTKAYALTPNDIQAEYEEKQIKTSDGYVIHSWHIFPLSGTDKKNSMIISYGDSGNMANWLGMASLLSQAGYDVWLYDYRGFGQSSDFKLNNDQLYYNEFLYDLSAVVNAVKVNKPDNQLTLFGFSMGTIISLMYLYQHPDDVDYYIAEGIVYSPEKIIGKLQSINGRNLVDVEVPTPEAPAVDARALYKGSAEGQEGGSQDALSFSLSGRSVRGQLGQPENTSNKEGRVVVAITVDQLGKVIQAKARAQGSTVQDATLWRAAEKAAMETLFNVDTSAPPLQTGTITCIFRLR